MSDTLHHPPDVPLPSAEAATVRHVDALGALAGRALARLHGTDGRWQFLVIQARGVASGRRRLILRAQHPGTGATCVIKSNATPLRTLAEHRALARLHRYSPDSVAPLYLDPFARFFAMDWCAAPLLLNVLRGPDRPGALTRAGRWLRALHDAPARRPLIRTRLPILAPPADGHDAGVARALRARLDSVDHRTGPMAMLHGDCYSVNFFDDGRRVIAFDRERDLYGPTHYDVARFLADIALRRADDARNGTLWGGDGETDRRAFFDGYGPVAADSLPLFDLIEDLIVHRMWSRQRPRKAALVAAEMEARGLIGASGRDRPGRLVAAPDGSVGWVTTPAAA